MSKRRKSILWWVAAITTFVTLFSVSIAFSGQVIDVGRKIIAVLDAPAKLEMIVRRQELMDKRQGDMDVKIDRISLWIGVPQKTNGYAAGH